MRNGGPSTEDSQLNAAQHGGQTCQQALDKREETALQGLAMGVLPEVLTVGAQRQFQAE